MFYLISGGSGSGKSEYAEHVAMKLRDAKKDFIYIATMMAYDEEAKKKIQRHLDMRKDKEFQTVECFTNLAGLNLPPECTVLLDCMSNLAANEMFQENGAKDHTVEEVVKGVEHILKQCSNLVIVTNEIFSDGCQYDEATKAYIRTLGNINTSLGKRADAVVEVTCGIPIYYKGKEVAI